MIRTADGDGGLLDKYVSLAFLETMAHFCNIDTILPSVEAKCNITEDEVRAFPNPKRAILLLVGPDWEVDKVFGAVGGDSFVIKKLVQLVKIAKADDSIQLDLVSELLLGQIGINAEILGIDSTVKDFPEMQALLDQILIPDDGDEITAEINAERIEGLESFASLMSADRKEVIGVMWDADWSFLLERTVPGGIELLYLASTDYGREWHERPWKDIGEAVPSAVSSVLDAADKRAEPYGGIEEMRAFVAQEHTKALFSRINALNKYEEETHNR